MTEEKITGTHKTVWKVVDEVREEGLDKRGMGRRRVEVSVAGKRGGRRSSRRRRRRRRSSKIEGR